MADLSPPRYRILSPLPPIGGIPRDLAEDTVDGTKVEIARYPRTGPATRFADTARRYQAVAHPCLTSIRAWTEDPPTTASGTCGVVEAHLAGRRLTRQTTLPRGNALLVAADVADALAALHAQGLRHGALAPEAIVLDGVGRPHIGGAGTADLAVAALGAIDSEPSLEADVRALGDVLLGLLGGRRREDDTIELPDGDPVLNGLAHALATDDPQRPPPPAAAVALRLRDLAGVGDHAAAAVRPAPAPAPAVVVAAPADSRPVVHLVERRRMSDLALLVTVGAITIAGVLAAFALTRDDGLPFTDSSSSTTVTVSSTPGASTPATVPVGTEPASTETVAITSTESITSTEITSVPVTPSTVTVTTTVAGPVTPTTKTVTGSTIVNAVTVGPQTVTYVATVPVP